MNFVFSFFLRLFICFVAAKLLVLAVDLNSRPYLLSLTAVLLINVYLLDYLVFRDRRGAPVNPEQGAPSNSPEGPPPSPDS
jgi:hypothetical protein